jgi:site-specific DNA-methyltransferase (adenine-specific)
MQYLCRLVTPPNGTILDPFLGSGSTGKAAMYEGFNFVGFDLNSEYIAIAKARIEFAIKNKNNTLFEHE